MEIGMNRDITEEILEKKIIAIVRGVEKDLLVSLAEALYAGGIRFMEITFDQSGKCPAEETADGIRILSEKMQGRMDIGAGTVLTKEQVVLAKGAGAKFIISPDTNPEVIRETKRLQMLSLPGAFTPSEAQCAYAAGADFVKLFPIGNMGVDYIKAIAAPLCHIPFLAVGGVDNENMPEYLNAGVCGFGIGSTLIRKDWIREGRFSDLTELALKYTKVIEEWNDVHSH